MQDALMKARSLKNKYNISLNKWQKHFKKIKDFSSFSKCFTSLMACSLNFSLETCEVGSLASGSALESDFLPSGQHTVKIISIHVINKLLAFCQNTLVNTMSELKTKSSK